ncbi:beta-ketoacyl-ACP reductase [Microbulbifer yueqingensis]|uniref:3-oxoacyl-[acyl-carrier-protein] reductase n=1 Tax=Microbulbifer yueqingensis TaxID=658219 RepID=A0A1G8VL46_9GAMM|nr:beta-ketoacyl-ACP reductase [Microbulbifer yueqingensis]SDJ66679.1 3-oxoacyl-[acyl-carrier-protein] reductase [Microbulbifer yueqingensis]
MSAVALVTGGTRGIGKAISLYLKDSGYEVVASYRSDEAAASQFTSDFDIPAVKFDASNFLETKEAMQGISEEFGDIAILVNNAGITRDSLLKKMEPSAWLDVIETDLNSVFNTCRSVLDSMERRGFGRIVNIGSINGLSGQYGQTNYSAAKAGIVGFTKSLALEVAKHGITVNCVAPGYIDTDMMASIPEAILNKVISKIPVGRLGSPSEVARVVGFLIHDESSFITGETFSVNGGQYMQ